MKIEKINDNKIRITLSDQELEARNLDFKSLRYNTPEAQTLFWDMMKQAENEHGFITANCQLFIEAASVNNGQFIVTITKLQSKVLPPVPQKRKSSALPEIKVRKKISDTDTIIYKFNDFEQLYQLTTLAEIPLALPSSLYEYKNAFFLITKALPKIHLLISEFGEVVKDSEMAEGFLYEHGNKIIATLAIKTIKENFNSPKRKNKCDLE